MERKKTVEVKEEPVVDNRVWYRKTGGGSLYWGNKIIKPNERFLADPKDLPIAFMDTLECLEVEKEKAVVEGRKTEQDLPEVIYTLKKIKGTNMYNLKDDSGKVLNEEPLTKEAALELKSILEA